ncbi:TRAP transporter substrate-binding protein [Pelistega suis]|uniref:TRAP transporter substrate-binding protein n=1 Tax=Pelistega suis TaxID=1631957 RepID=UPI00211CCF08|nr:TRAP transporter substrate-binding protein [Pelistega suis]MCQ9329329.1 TRAP transporter substrate-binding protein [Pelistega suis]
MMKLSKLITGLTLALTSLAAGQVAYAKNFRLGLVTPATHVWTKAAESFSKDFETASNGEHKVTVFPAGQLGNEAQMLQQLQTGALDMAFLTAAELTNRHVDMGILFAPYLVKNVDQVPALLASKPAQDLLTDLPRKAGVVGVAYGTGGLRQMISVNAVQSVADLKGKKIRITPQVPLQDFYRNLGVAPISLPLSGVFDAMSNKQVDGTDMDLEIIVGLKLYDIADTTLLSNHMMWPVVGVVSARVWSTLSDSDKKNIQDTMSKYLAETGSIYSAKEKEWKQALLATGKNTKEVGPEFFQDAINQWETKWEKQTPLLKALRDASKEISQ